MSSSTNIEFMQDDWIRVIPCKSHLCVITCVLYHSVQTVSVYVFVWIYSRAVRVKETKGSVLLDASQPCLPVCVAVC